MIAEVVLRCFAVISFDQLHEGSYFFFSFFLLFFAGFQVLCRLYGFHCVCNSRRDNWSYIDPCKQISCLFEAHLLVPKFD